MLQGDLITYHTSIALEKITEKRALDYAERLFARSFALDQMKHLFGGREAYEALPVLNLGNRSNWHTFIDFINLTDLKTDKVMRGIDKFDRHFFVLKYLDNTSGKEVVITFFETSDSSGQWAYGGNPPSGFGPRNVIYDNETFLAEFISKKDIGNTVPRPGEVLLSDLIKTAFNHIG